MASASGTPALRLIAAWYDGGCPRAEGETLRWLESQNAPDIVACRDAPAEIYEAWVPMNSVPNWNKKSGKRPTMPKATQRRSSRYVGDTPVAFVWAADVPPRHESPLRNLCSRCTRLGSAESLVAMTVRSARRPPRSLHGVPPLRGPCFEWPCRGSWTPLREPRHSSPDACFPATGAPTAGASAGGQAA